MCVHAPLTAPSAMVGHDSSAVSTMEQRQGALGGLGETKEEPSIDPTHPNEHPVLKLPSLLDNLRVVERAVVQNAYQAKQALYRGLQVVKGKCACAHDMHSHSYMHRCAHVRMYVHTHTHQCPLPIRPRCRAPVHRPVLHGAQAPLGEAVGVLLATHKGQECLLHGLE